MADKFSLLLASEKERAAADARIDQVTMAVRLFDEIMRGNSLLDDKVRQLIDRFEKPSRSKCFVREAMDMRSHRTPLCKYRSAEENYR